jgi:hypothetical protein
MVPYVELPLVTPFTVQVTAVLVVLATAAVIAKVPFTGTVCALVGVVMETATAGGADVVADPPPQPTITISRLKLIPKTQAVRRRPGIIDPTPIKPDFRFDSVGIKDSSVGLK